MDFTVESWDPSYGASLEVAELDLAAEPVDVSVEVPEEEWAPIRPAPATAAADTVTFIDGVRRIDARVWITHDGVTRPGVCATVAAGAVRADGQATVLGGRVFRGLYALPLGAGPIVTRSGTYELVACTDDTPEAIYLGIHDQMTHLEREVSDDASGGTGVVVFDGPLRGRRAANGIGYVKTQHVRYLPEAEQRVIGRLAAGDRTPVFLIGGRFTRYSWYLRLPGPPSHPLAGVVRCEAPGVGEVGDVVASADAMAVTLPRFASEPHKDGRAPQNLYPIAGLERALRRRLGDAALMERALRLASRSSSATISPP